MGALATDESQCLRCEAQRSCEAGGKTVVLLMGTFGCGRDKRGSAKRCVKNSTQHQLDTKLKLLHNFASLLDALQVAAGRQGCSTRFAVASLRAL